MNNIHDEKILILDFGSQYTMLIARRVRELKVYCEIHPCHLSPEEIKRFAPKGIILSGGPDSVTRGGAPRCAPQVFELGVPVLGICYGLQLIAHTLGGEVQGADEREYGPADLYIKDPRGLFEGLCEESAPGLRVWMSHGDRVVKLPPGFTVLAYSTHSPIAAAADLKRKIFGVQFHPEVHHTPQGKEILRNFLYNVCGCRGLWTIENFIQRAEEDIRRQVGHERVLMALSGGVDSAVAATLIYRAIGDRLTCIFVDNGLMRQGEPEMVEQVFTRHFDMDLKVVHAKARFLARLAGVTDPEKKRKIIGEEFIRVFEEQARRINGARFLGQGTLYPDVIESTSVRGPSATIKSHHNVGGLPERMEMELLEPLRELFKDEVRELGLALGLPEKMVWRQPFPGPGLAVRILGEVTEEQLRILRAADHIATSEIEAAGLERNIWQYFVVLLPVKTVGVMGDSRTYDNAVALRAVVSTDGMTADFADLPHPLLSRIASRIINEVKGVNRVVYDISSKPPSTIEWE